MTFTKLLTISQVRVNQGTHTQAKPLNCYHIRYFYVFQKRFFDFEVFQIFYYTYFAFAINFTVCLPIISRTHVIHTYIQQIHIPN